MATSQTRILVSKYNGMCKSCPAAVYVGDRIYWTPGVKGVRHVDCNKYVGRIPVASESADEPIIPSANDSVVLRISELSLLQLQALRVIIDSAIAQAAGTSEASVDSEELTENA